MAQHVKIDLDKLSAAIRSYDTVISEFEQAVEDTKQAIQQLRDSGWRSGASEAYFLQYEDTWKTNMEKRLKIIQHLKECLVLAEQEYTDLYHEMLEIGS